MCFDLATGSTLLFGGQSSALQNDSWRYDGTTWTQVASAATPPARQGHAMVFDAVRGRALLFGGYGSNGAWGDAWELRGGNWTQCAPGSRSSHSLACDAGRGRLVMFGGFERGTGSTGLLAADTWEYAGCILDKSATKTETLVIRMVVLDFIFSAFHSAGRAPLAAALNVKISAFLRKISSRITRPARSSSDRLPQEIRCATLSPRNIVQSA
jgi:hypothetical protein